MCTSAVLQGLILRAYTSSVFLLLLWRRCCDYCQSHRGCISCCCCCCAGRSLCCSGGGGSWKQLPPSQQIERLRLRASEFQKRPEHVAVVIDCNEELGYSSSWGEESRWIHERVAALACWSAAIGISALTIYDADGYLAASVEELTDAVNRQKIDAAIPSVRFNVCCGPGAHAKEDAVDVGMEVQTGAVPRRRGVKRVHEQLHASAGGAGDPTGASAGNDARPKVDITVTLLSAMDGQEDVAEMTRRLAADAAAEPSGAPKGRKGKQGASDVNEELVSALLRAYKTFNGGDGVESVPETVSSSDGPELLIRFTPGGALRAALTTDGFPPWYLRLTEIHHHGAFSEFRWVDFLMALHRYAKCEQRFGT